MKFKIHDECGFGLLFQRSEAMCLKSSRNDEKYKKQSLLVRLRKYRHYKSVKGIFYFSLTLQNTILVITNVVQVSVTIRNK
jgi:hypothetical protein